MKACFVEQLPERVRAILAILDTSDLDKLAEAADKICDSYGPPAAPAPEICADRTAPSTAILETILRRLDSLESKFNERSRS